MPIISQNPATEEIIKEYKEYTDQEIDNQLFQSVISYNLWKSTSFEFRAVLFIKLEQLLLAQKHELGLIITREMGKPIKESIAEVEKSALVFRYYAENAKEILADKNIVIYGQKSFISYEPLGTILAVMPWNFPFWQVFRFAAPTIMAGNVGILKHASNVPASALKIQDLFEEAGFPKGVFQTMLIGSGKVADVIANPAIKALSLTGSEYAGSQASSTAAKYIKKSVLELGGSDPFIVLEDADIEAAVMGAIQGRFLNNGQSCIAAKRFLVSEKIFDIFVNQLKIALENLVVGNPELESTNLGPMVNSQARADLKKQLADSVAMGAKVVSGGKDLFEKGYFFAPTIVVNVSTQMPLMSEEVFGPILPIFKFKTIEEAINIANNTDLGLGASIWSKNIAKATSIAKKIESGSVYVNSIVRSDVRLSFGGIKNSGFGRELGDYGIKEFVNIKTTVIKSPRAILGQLEDLGE